MRRIFICDPACVLPFGHNPFGVNYFTKHLNSRFDKAFGVCCRYLPKEISDRHGFVPFYDFYYDDYVTIERPANAPKAIPMSRKGPDPLEQRATEDAARLMRQYDISSNDSLMFPSLDFYGAVGLLNALQGLPRSRWPTLYFRFIGVMEYSSRRYPDAQPELIMRLKRALADGISIRFAAEVPAYARQISALLGQPVAVVPYPEVGPLMPIGADEPFVVYLPGSARGDKGFFELYRIFAAARRLDPEGAIRFVTQVLPDRELEQHQRYVSQLYAVPGVELLPAIIPATEMDAQYRRCHAVLLPYETHIYKVRGSSVMMEAACFGRPIVTLTGTGFADQVAAYGLGEAVPAIDDMVPAILGLSRMKRADIEDRAARARARFAADSAAAYEEWMRP